MKDCEWCNLSDEDKKYMLFQTEAWEIFLADKQDYIGRCILVCKRHVKSLYDLSAREWMDLKNVIDKLEQGLAAAFGATMFNWSCLMNDFYKSDNPNPHLHLHVRPRYKNPVIMDDKVFLDEEFAHHYNPKKAFKIHEADFQKIYLLLKNHISD